MSWPVRLATLPALVACSGGEAPPADPPRPSLVLVTFDTTRADRVGAYGYDQPTTPTVDALAAEGVRFERAYATVPLTTPSHASILTGLYPTRHGVHTNGDATLPDEIETLAEILKGQGYATAASVSAFVTTRIWNLDQGFDAYFDEVPARPGRWGRERPADETVGDAIGWVEQQEGPFFLWVHFYDPHHPHTAPPEHLARFADPYDAEIAFVDAQVARLRDVVDRKAGDDGAAWIVTSDHGEAFGGEHGESSHGLFLFDPTSRVPFVVRPPKPLAEPIVSELTASGADVTPTALGLLGLSAPDGLDGVDLSPIARGQRLERPPVYMESYTVEQRLGYHPELAMAEGPLKLMATPDARLYDVASDPGETQNLLRSRPDDVARLRAALDRVEAQAVDITATHADPAVIEQLAALGYVGAGGAFGGERSEIDAKTRLETIERLERTRELALVPGAATQVEQAYREILKTEPQLAEARTGLANALQAQGRYEDALRVYEEAIALEPDSIVLRSSYANALAGAGRKQQGLAEMEGILLKVPGDDVARVGVIKMLSDLGRHDEALARAERWLAEDPDDATMQAHAGVLLTRFGELERAEGLLRASLADGVPRIYAHRSLANILLARGDDAAAVAHLRAELDGFPAHHDVRRQLAQVLMRLGDWDEAAAEYAWVVERDAQDVEARLGYAQAVFNAGDYETSARVLAPALEQAPEDPFVLLLHANLLDKQGDRAQATRVFERAKAALAAQKP